MRAALFFTGLMLLCLGAQPALAQSSPRHYLSAGTNNSTLVLGRNAILKFVHAGNTTATIYYLKFYNKATAPTCGTDTPVLTLPVPPTTANPIQPPITDGLLFPLGIGFCLVAGIADNDNTVAATGVAINVGVTGR